MKLNPILLDKENIDLDEVAKTMAGSTCDLTEYVTEINGKLDNCLKTAKLSMVCLNEFIEKTSTMLKKHIIDADNLTKDAAKAQAVNVNLSKRAMVFAEEQEAGRKIMMEYMDLESELQEDDIAEICMDGLDCRRVVIKMVNNVERLKAQL